MKKSIKRLPKKTQEELEILKELILKYVSEIRMIILFGSFPRGNYVLWEEGLDFGVPYVYQSDLDILIIAETNKPAKAEAHVEKFALPKYHKQLAHRRHSEPSVLVENEDSISRALRKKQYFFTEIIKDGILLYDDQKLQLPNADKLSYRVPWTSLYLPTKHN